MAESLIDFLAREYEFVRAREGRDFFLALGPYAEELRGKRRIRRALKRLEAETTDAAKRYADDQNNLIAEAKRIRYELADRAPEIDNSNMERPDPTTHAYGRWKYDSFAGFDDRVERDANLQIGYPAIPGDHDDPGVLGDMLQILRGRHRAAVYGEDASINAAQIRVDLDDLGNRLGSVGRHREHALTRFRQESRTLPGLAFGRLVYFGSDLNPEPPSIETDEDVEKWLDQTLREWGKPKTIVRKMVNAEQMDDWERGSAAETETFLKGELDRLHQELVRHSGGDGVSAWVRQPLVVGIVGGVVATVVASLILVYGFGIGEQQSSAEPTAAIVRSATRQVFTELVTADVSLERAAKTRQWFSILPIRTRQWETHRDVLAAALPRADWDGVSAFYALAEDANENPQAFTGDSGRTNVELLRRRLEEAFRAVGPHVT